MTRCPTGEDHGPSSLPRSGFVPPLALHARTRLPRLAAMKLRSPATPPLLGPLHAPLRRATRTADRALSPLRSTAATARTAAGNLTDRARPGHDGAGTGPGGSAGADPAAGGEELLSLTLPTERESTRAVAPAALDAVTPHASHAAVRTELASAQPSTRPRPAADSALPRSERHSIVAHRSPGTTGVPTWRCDQCCWVFTDPAEAAAHTN